MAMAGRAAYIVKWLCASPSSERPGFGTGPAGVPFRTSAAGCPTAWESGFEQTPAGTLGSWMAKAGVTGRAKAAATIIPPRSTR
jgi:hypothetical protein